MNSRRNIHRATLARPEVHDDRRERSDMKVLFMSGYADDEEFRRALDAGGRLVSKPITPDVLRRSVRDVLDAVAAR